MISEVKPIIYILHFTTATDVLPDRYRKERQSISQPMNQIPIVPISPACPAILVQEWNQCSTANLVEHIYIYRHVITVFRDFGLLQPPSDVANNLVILSLEDGQPGEKRHISGEILHLNDGTLPLYEYSIDEDKRDAELQEPNIDPMSEKVTENVSWLGLD